MWRALSTSFDPVCFLDPFLEVLHHVRLGMTSLKPWSASATFASVRRRELPWYHVSVGTFALGLPKFTHPVRSSPPRWKSLWMALRLNVSMFPAPWTGKCWWPKDAQTTTKNAWCQYPKIKVSPCWTGLFFSKNIFVIVFNIELYIYWYNLIHIYHICIYIYIYIHLFVDSFQIQCTWIYLQSQLWRQGFDKPNKALAIQGGGKCIYWSILLPHCEMLRFVQTVHRILY